MKQLLLNVALILNLCILSVGSFASLEPIKPKFEPQKLEEFTKLTLRIVPDVGTRLVFPFRLDTEGYNPQITVTNNRVFFVNGAGQGEEIPVATNELVITAAPPQNGKEALGHIFVRVAEYTISIALKLSFDTRNHKTDLVFHPSKEAREYLIEKGVERRKEALEKEYQQKLAEVETRAKEVAMKYAAIMAMYDPDKEDYHRTRDVELKNRDQFELYFGTLKNYNNEYLVLNFEIEHEGLKTIGLEKYQLGVYKDNDQAEPEWLTPLEVNCPDRLLPKQTIKCAIVTTDNRILDNKVLEMRIQTTEGEMLAKW